MECENTGKVTGSLAGKEAEYKKGVGSSPVPFFLH